MKTQSGLKKLNILFSVLSLVIIALVWIIAYYAVGNGEILPSLWDSLAAMGKCFVNAFFWQSFAKTFLRAFIAFVSSLLLAALFAALSAVCNPFKRIFSGIISALRTLPTMAVTLMLLLWTNPSVAPVIVSALVLFPLSYSRFLAAIEGVDKELLEMAKAYSLSRAATIKGIYFPQVAPSVFFSFGADFSLSIKLTVSAEVLSYTFVSLGGMMQQYKLYGAMPSFAAVTLVCVALGMAFEGLFSLFANLFARKRGAL